MRSFIIFLVTILLCPVLQGQKIEIPKNKIPVLHPDFFAWVEVYDGEIKDHSIENDRTYYWLKAKQLHSSKGGYHGELLHGQYTALYKTDALKEKGKYNKGLKTGEWKEWFPNGELKCISNWKNGRPGRYFTHYNEQGIITKKERYRNGLLHGRQVAFSDSSETITRFRKGKPVIKKPKVKKQKVKAEHATEIPIAKDSMATDSSKIKQPLRIFKKKKTTKDRTPEIDPKTTTNGKKTAEVKKPESKKKKNKTENTEVPNKKDE